jgi:hypothetical protein
MSGDLVSGPMHYLGFGALEMLMIQVVHGCRSVCAPLTYAHV